MDIEKNGPKMPEFNDGAVIDEATLEPIQMDQSMPELEYQPGDSTSFPTRKKMSRQDLIEILTLDGTIEQIDKAIASKELTPAERDRIYDFLLAEDERQSEKLFARILKDVEAAPVYESAKEEKKAWKEMRLDLAHQIDDLQNQRFELMGWLEKFETQARGVEQSLDPEDARGFRDSVLSPMLRNAERLQIKTNQHSALALMHAEAKTMEGQANARIFTEATQPLRDTLKHAWQSSVDHVRTAHHQMANVRATIKETKRLDRHLVDDLKNKIDLGYARVQLKNLNKAQSKIDKAERKMLAKANKIVEKEFRKASFRDKLDSWSKGERPPKREIELVQDVEQAAKVLSESKKHSEKSIEAMKSNLDKLREHRDEAKQDLTSTLNRVSARMVQRREHAQDVARKAHDLYERGELGEPSERRMGKIESNLEKGFDSTFIGRDNTSADMYKYLSDPKNGFDHLVKPSETRDDRER